MSLLLQICAFITVLRAEDCAKAVAFVEDGRSQRYGARVLNVSHSTIERILARFRKTGRNIRKSRCGRKRKSTANDDRFLVLNTYRIVKCVVSKCMDSPVKVTREISVEACTELVFIDGEPLTAQRYIEEILVNHVVPFVPFIGDDFVHASRCVTAHLMKVGLEKLNWPAFSPDGNLMYIWDKLGRRVRSRAVAPTTKNELRVTPQEE
ncbi:hypothetical protein ILUMI_03626 [Ignelater luminosus]|uniref:Transposase n=1 Tax=Ignelater luminosus TaxID=2038154 RepID=A0A8K0GM00_IGNLU|nr:hypothetical protein ILUMI_03626 [Ignelater luminosus]